MMKTKAIVSALTIALIAAVAADAAVITIVNNVKGFLGSDKTKVTTAHNGTTEISYDATGVDKLVVAIGTESGNNNSRVTSMGLKFNGVDMTQAVFSNTWVTNPGDCGGLAIFYLDNPGSVTSNFTVSVTTTSGGPNGGLVSIFGLANTKTGVGNVSSNAVQRTSAGTVSTSITTTADDSWVLAAVENSGTNNNAGTPTVVSPLTLGHNGSWGSQWGSVASGYQAVPTSGTSLTPTFNTNAGYNIQVVAAEFLVIPEPATLGMLGVAGLALIVRRRVRG